MRVVPYVSAVPEASWHEWVERWERQQERYLPEREARFTTGGRWTSIFTARG